MDIQITLETWVSFQMHYSLFHMTFVVVIRFLTMAWQRFVYDVLFLFNNINLLLVIIIITRKKYRTIKANLVLAISSLKL